MDCENGGYLTPHCKSCEYWHDGYSWDFGCSNPHFDKCLYLKPVEMEEPVPKNKYTYNGPVMIFDECVQTRWQGTTAAVSKQKAKTNLTYQWKKEHGYAPNTKVKLPGRIEMIG